MTDEPLAVVFDVGTGLSTTRPCTRDEAAELVAGATVAQSDAAEANARGKALEHLQAAAVKNPDVAALMTYLGIPTEGAP